MAAIKLSSLTKIAAAVLVSSIAVNAFAADLLDTIKARGTRRFLVWLFGTGWHTRYEQGF